MIFGVIGAGALCLATVAAAFAGHPVYVAGTAVLAFAGFVAFALAMGCWGRGIYEKIKGDVCQATSEADTLHRRFLTLSGLLPDPVAWVSPQGRVELASRRAEELGIRAGTDIQAIGEAWLLDLVGEAMRRLETVSWHNPGEPAGSADGVMPLKIGNEEMICAPQAAPVLDASGAIAGVVVLLWDRTAARRAEESRRKVLSTISHDLCTPMTSIQMSIHLLLEDAASRLTPRQLELLAAARDDAERLHRMTEELLRKARDGEMAGELDRV